MMRLLLARHGVTAWNQGGRYQGHQDVPIGDLGRQQAERLGLRLRAETIDAVYSSDLARARETATLAVAGRGIAVQETPLLRETLFGAWEGLSHEEIASRFPAEWDAWVRDPLHARPPGGESLAELRERLTAFYRSIADERAIVDGRGIADERSMAEGPDSADRTLAESPSPEQPRDWFSYRAAGQGIEDEQQQTLLVVSHGGPIRVLLTILLDIPTERYWRFGVRPASLTILDIYPEGAIAEVIGDTSHLL